MKHKSRVVDLRLNAADWETNSAGILQYIREKYEVVLPARQRLDRGAPGVLFRPGYNIRVAHPDFDEVPENGIVPERHVECINLDDGNITIVIL